MRRKAPHNPSSSSLDKRIRRPHGVTHNCLVQNFRRTGINCDLCQNVEIVQVLDFNKAARFLVSPNNQEIALFRFGRTDRLYVFYEFDSCPKILESVRALQLKELGTAAARERHCPAILQSSVPRQYLAVGAAPPRSVSC